MRINSCPLYVQVIRTTVTPTASLSGIRPVFGASACLTHTRARTPAADGNLPLELGGKKIGIEFFSLNKWTDLEHEHVSPGRHRAHQNRVQGLVVLLALGRAHVYDLPLQIWNRNATQNVFLKWPGGILTQNRSHVAQTQILKSAICPLPHTRTHDWLSPPWLTAERFYAPPTQRAQRITPILSDSPSRFSPLAVAWPDFWWDAKAPYFMLGHRCVSHNAPLRLSAQ